MPTETESEVVDEGTGCRRGTRERKPPAALAYDKNGEKSISSVDAKVVMELPRSKPSELPARVEPSTVRGLLNYISSRINDCLELIE